LLFFQISDFSSLVVSNCSFSDNDGRGLTLKDITGKLVVSKTAIRRNKGDGLSAERILGTAMVTETKFVNNRREGLGILNSSFLSCNLQGLYVKGNSRNGLFFQRVAMKSNISDSSFDANWANGFEIDDGSGDIQFRRVKAVLNSFSGVRLTDGKISSTFLFCNFSQNRQYGCYISNQEGAFQLFNCSANSNLRHGVSLMDARSYYNDPSRHQFRHFSMVSSTIKGNGQYGVNLRPDCWYSRESAMSVTVTILNNQIERNRGGIILSPDYCYWYWYSAQKPRKVSALVSNNHFQGNKVNAFHVYCTGRLGLEAVIELNMFVNNTVKVLTIIDDNQCWSNDKSNPVRLKIRQNVFKMNRVTENVLFIDLSAFPETRSSTVINNTFEENKLATKLPSLYRRTSTHAVIVIKEGTFVLRENIFENPGFTFQMSSLRPDHLRVVDAKFNWWGTTDECEIVDKIFDFRHRVHLSPIDFFPYRISYNESDIVNANISRPSCFLRNRSIGGILDRPLILSSEGLPYAVRDDIVILAKGSLVIQKNVTLVFPPRSAMVVQGSLHVGGTENEKVRFKKQSPYHGKFRLAGASGPWEGRVEFLVNGTWLPLCLPYYKLFYTESRIICQQLNFDYRSYSRRSLSGMETTFVHNVVCDENVDADIMKCSSDTWRYGPTCRGYTVYVYCERRNWVGLHLAMSQHQSSLHHLEIYDAGFAYRNDINIPGAALKIDFNHHNISNIFINGSDGIGVEVVFQSLFHNLSLMSSSTISYTKSHGIYSLSPLTLADVDLIRNDGNGFLFTSNWDKTNNFAAYMASPNVNRIFHICSRNKTFVQASKVFHYTLEPLNTSLQLNCQQTMETEPGYKLVIQLLYFERSYGFMRVYDGVNMSVGSPWNMEAISWRDRPVFNSTCSSILFQFNKRVGGNLKVNFLVYTIKGWQTFFLSS